ncbi:S26 family signal peptidase [bacterium]|nr:S26 family signal peptidase [bacterium]
MNKPLITNRQVSYLDLNHEGFLELLEAVLDKGKAFRFRVAGTSMRPYIKDGDVVTIEKIHRKILQIGDVVAAIHPENGRLIVHRIIKKTPNGYRIRGDNISNSEALIQKAKIYGIVSHISRDGNPVTFGLGHEKILIALRKPFDRDSVLIQPIIRYILRIMKKLSK